MIADVNQIESILLTSSETQNEIKCLKMIDDRFIRTVHSHAQSNLIEMLANILINSLQFSLVFQCLRCSHSWMTTLVINHH